MSVDPRLADLLIQWEELQEQGRGVAPEDLCKNCPELVAELTRRVRALQAMNPVLRTAVPEGTADAGADTFPNSADNQSAPLLPGYEILCEVGRGGMGVVYKARQKSLGRLVALKMTLAGSHTSADQLARFRTEAEAVARLQHPNIVHIYEVGEHEGRPYFALEFIDGQNLDEHLSGHPQPPAEAAQLVETLARAMDYAHQQGIIHRDLKPGNILLANRDASSSGERFAEGKPAATSGLPRSPHLTPKITDFGLAKRLNDARGRTRTGAVLGTPSYMAPEQADGRIQDIGPGTDIYALGAILYELLTGRPPFEGTTSWETINQVLASDPLPPSQMQPKVPRDLETICLKCLQKEPRKRYLTAEALADDLRRFLDGQPVLARPLGYVGRAVKWARRRPALAGLLGVSLLGIVAFLIFGSIFTARLYQANENAREEAAKTQKMLVRLHVANGIHYLEDDDLFSAMTWLTEALGIEPDRTQDNLHRDRLAAILGRCPRLHQIWFHKSGVNHVEFSRDGKRVVTASDDNTARVWDAASGAPITPPLAHKRSVLWASFDPKGQNVVTASADGTACVWDATSGEAVTPLLRHEKDVRSAVFSSDGRRVLTASDDGTAQVWDAAIGKRELAEPMRHEGAVVRAYFSPDGKRILTASADHTARVWEAVTGKEILEPLAHDGPVTNAEFNASGDRIITSSLDHTARIWNADGKPLRKFLHQGPVNHATFDHDGKRVATASSDMSARIWDTETGESVVAVHHLSPVDWVIFSGDGRLLGTASDDNTARVWDAATGKPRTPPLTHNGTVGQIAFSPDGTRLLTASDDNTARLLGTGPRQPPLATLKHAGPVWQASFGPKGGRVVTASEDHTARVWDVGSGECVGSPLTHQGPVYAATFSPDGTSVLTASADGTAQVWDAVTGKPFFSPALQHRGPVRCAAYSADGSRIISGSDDGTARVWDAATGKAVTPPLIHLGPVRDAVFSPDGSLVATASAKDFGRIWNAVTGKEMTKPLKHDRALTQITFSPDGQRVATASEDKSARIWDAKTGVELGRPLRQAGTIHSVAFSPDGQRILTAGDDNTARVWNPANAELLYPPLWQYGAVRKARFSPDGSRVVTASDDSTVLVWDAAAGVPLSPALNHPGWGRLTDARFAPDGRRVSTASVDGTARVWEFGREDRPAEDLERLAQLLSGSRIDEKRRGMVPLDSSAMEEIWKNLRAKYPDEFAGR